jgi:hypothetical protein
LDGGFDLRLERVGSHPVSCRTLHDGRKIHDGEYRTSPPSSVLYKSPLPI